VTWLLDAAAAGELPFVWEETPPSTEVDPAELKLAAGRAAAAAASDGMVIGLGTGSTVRYTTEEIARRLATGDLRQIAAVPTSRATTELAKGLGIPLVTLEDHPVIDLAIDGADEVSPDLDLIKGLGGALLREKIVAATAKRFLVVTDQSKRVGRLGERSPLPIAVVPFGWSQHLSPLRDLGAQPELRRHPDGSPVVTDDGMWLIDCHFQDGIPEPAALEATVLRRPGIVATGLFLGMADAAYIATADGVFVLERG
jgi:ribose 5-phosphate isomerase A